MAKTVATIVGVVFILVGLVGFFAHGLLGAHLSTAHNLVHLISGAAALYFGTKGSLSAARTFCLIFGAVYGLLGLVGFIAGKPGTPGISGMEGMGQDSRLFQVIPGILELGTMDHIIHILIGLLFLAGAFLTRTESEPAAAHR